LETVYRERFGERRDSNNDLGGERRSQRFELRGRTACGFQTSEKYLERIGGEREGVVKGRGEKILLDTWGVRPEYEARALATIKIQKEEEEEIFGA